MGHLPSPRLLRGEVSAFRWSGQDSDDSESSPTLNDSGE